mgnify:CR=1 FL=1
MVDKFWDYFEKTGDIKVYLEMKEYEKTHRQFLEKNNNNID